MFLETRTYSSLLLALLILSCGDSSSSKKAPEPDVTPGVTHTNAGPQNPGLRIVDFSLPFGGVDYGDDVQLRWKVDGASACKLENTHSKTLVPLADKLAAEGSLSLPFEQFKDLPFISLTLVCSSSGQRSVEQTLRVPVAQLVSFQADKRTVGTNDKITLTWSASGMRGACMLDGQEAPGAFKTLVIGDQPKTIRTFKLSCPGYQKSFEQDVTVYILPKNRLLWYLASDFTMNDKLIDAELDATHQVTGDEPIKLSWQMGEGVACSAKNGFEENAPRFDIITEGRQATLTLGELNDSTVIISCEADKDNYPFKSTSIYLTIKRRTATIGAISQSSIITSNIKEGYIDPKPIYGGDTFRLYAQLQNLDAKQCKIGLEGESGGELLEFWPYKTSLSKQTYQRTNGEVKGWIECQIADGLYKKTFSVTVADARKQPCPEKYIKIYDRSQLSLPAACPKVPLVLMALDSKVWESDRAASDPLKVKLADGQAFYASFHPDIDRYGVGSRSDYTLENLLFSYDYLHKPNVDFPLQIEIEGGARGLLASLHFSTAYATKITVKNVKNLTHDLAIVSNRDATIQLPDLESAGYLLAAGNQRAQVRAPQLKQITGSGQGDVTREARRQQPSIGGVYLHRNISLLIEAAIESVRGGFTVEGNVGDVSLVPPGVSAAGLIQQPLKEILKAAIPADAENLLHQRMNGSLLISGNEVLLKVLLPELVQIEDGGVIGRMTNLALVGEFTRDGELLSSGVNPRLVELDLAKLKREIKVLPSDFTLDLSYLADKKGFDHQFHVVKDPLLKF